MAGEQVSKRSVVYEILVDFQQGKKSVQDAEKAIEEFSREVNGAATGVEKFAKSTEASVGRLRQLKTQLNNFKGSQKDFEALSLEAARLQDQLDKTNRRIRTLASSTRQIEALASGVQGLVGVFTAVQGAAALFGQENKNLQQAILRVQGALALLQGVQAAVATVTEQSALKTIVYQNALKVYTFITNGATLATRLFNAALVASIGGAVLIGIGLLAANWQKVAAAIGLANKEQSEFSKQMTELGEKLKSEKLKQREQAFKDEIAVLEAQLLNTKENSKDQLEVNKELLRRKFEIAIKTEKRTNAEIYLLRVKLNKDLERLDREFAEKQKPSQGAPERRELEIAGTEEITRQYAFLAEQERLAREKAENEKQGFIVKTAEVQQTAHQALMSQMQEEEEMRKRLSSVAQSSATILSNLAQLASDNANAQLGLSIASVVAANAEALAKGVASAASIPWPGNIAAIFSTIATITSIFAQISSISKQARAANSSANSRQRNAVAFAEGTPYLDDASAPHGRDTIPIWADRGEAIIPTRKNMEEPGLAAAWINGNLDEYIGINYVAPALAAKTIEEIKHDSTIDYSTRFYKQLLVTAEGNAINKKALTYLSSINDRLNRTIPSRYA